ncbi:hypothetical protein GCM10027168_57300 [Streptomyces capparidis]
MPSKWYWTTRSDTPASAAIARMLAASRPRPAAMRHTASAILRRCRAPVPVGRATGGTAGAPRAGRRCLRRRYALAWQLREQ